MFQSWPVVLLHIGLLEHLPVWVQTQTGKLKGLYLRELDPGQPQLAASGAKPTHMHTNELLCDLEPKPTLKLRINWREAVVNSICSQIILTKRFLWFPRELWNVRVRFQSVFSSWACGLCRLVKLSIVLRFAAAFYFYFFNTYRKVQVLCRTKDACIWHEYTEMNFILYLLSQHFITVLSLSVFNLSLLSHLRVLLNDSPGNQP